MRAALIRTYGPPSVIGVEELPDPVVGPGQVRIRVRAAGVGMPDVLIRSGCYPWAPPLPSILGTELAGEVVEAHQDVAAPAVGARVVVSARDLPQRGGCCAEMLVCDAEAARPLPDGVDFDAAACLNNYQVAWQLLHRAAGGLGARSVLVYAAAGGVGSALVQLASQAGQRVLAVAGSSEKCAFARSLGAAEAIDYRREDVLVRVRELTGGEGVDLVLDPVGGERFVRNFSIVSKLGLVVCYGRLEGWPSGDVFKAMFENFDRSPAMRLFTMHTFDDDRPARDAAMNALLELLRTGAIRPPIHARLPLAAARRAHELLEGGRVLGKLLLVP